ncbi:MAG: DUF1800 domain-containing protein [Chitinophagia bacterium]|nr:DUF1800 domain-containing protein [Chitinophagia bacterium]
MRNLLRTSVGIVGLLAFLSWGFTPPSSDPIKESIKMPYKKMGLTKQQAAAHLLSRFTMGATPGQVDAVVKQGLENWFVEQLSAAIPETDMVNRLPEANYPALQMSNEQLVNHYVNAGQALRLAVKNQLINKDSLQALNKPEYRTQLLQLMKQQGQEPLQELNRQLINQKIIRAAYSPNQLKEVLTDFWFNHFNVSLSKGASQHFVLSYERDAIRPYVAGNFYDLLIHTAQHPAMLEFLDNVGSVSNNNELSKKREQSLAARKVKQRMESMAADTANPRNAEMKQALARASMQGLNENYAREVMELHTMGVDGGYTQQDVTQVAKALTGWTVRPLDKDGAAAKIMQAAGPLAKIAEKDNVTVDDFLFRANRHDEGEKNILGKMYPANGGYQEGVQVLQQLASHPSTAAFISKKLAVRFIKDTPSVQIVEQMTATFLRTGGNIRAVLVTMVNHPDFWEAGALREKVKSPFELAISAIRATGADVQQPFQINNWITRMGQRLYFYAAPTGFPDRGNYWINTGSLLNRMNFGLAFATGKIPGVKLDLLALNQHHEPESAEDALQTYSSILLPERNQEANIRRLTSLLKETGLEEKIRQAANRQPVISGDEMNEGMEANRRNEVQQKNQADANRQQASTTGILQQVTGVIIGSPEFQRR